MATRVSLTPLAFLLLAFLISTTTNADQQQQTRNAMFTGQILRENQRLQFGKFALVMQDDCNLVFHNGQWQSHTANKGNRCFLALQDDGKLVILNENNRPVWSSEIRGRKQGEYALIIHPDGDLKVYGPDVWSTRGTTTTSPSLSLLEAAAMEAIHTPRVRNAIFSGETLNRNERLKNGQFEFVMQDDCNLVLHPNKWQSNTRGNGRGCFAVLNRQGRLSIRDESSNRVWDNAVRGTPTGEYAGILKDNGDFTIYGPVVWSTRHHKEADDGMLLLDDE